MTCALSGTYTPRATEILSKPYAPYQGTFSRVPTLMSLEEPFTGPRNNC